MNQAAKSKAVASLELDADLCQLASATAAELGIVGAQIAMLKDGALRQGIAGIANLPTGVEVTPDTLFQIGSTTKVFTAAIVMQLVEDGKIGLDTPVVEQLPGFALSDEQALRTLTPRHLMSMSSGIDNGPYTDHGRGDDAVARYVAALAGLPQVFAPGRGFGYSNASTTVSGRLIEHVTGQTWDDVLPAALLAPAGLFDSATLPEDIITRRFALGYRLDEAGQPTPVPRWSFPRSTGPPGGTLCSTAGDLVRFGHLFLHDGRTLSGTQVLSPEVVAAMQAHEVTVPPTGMADWWGLGPYGKTWDGVDLMGHSGTAISGSSYLLWAARRDVAIATTVNTPGLGYPFAARVFDVLFREAAGIDVPLRREPPEHVDYDPGRLVGQYQMCCSTLRVQTSNGELTIAGSGELHGDEELAPSRLIPLTPTTFLPTDARIDGKRGWALAFLGTDDGPASHLVNGVFTLRRVA